MFINFYGSKQIDNNIGDDSYCADTSYECNFSISVLSDFKVFHLEGS